MSSSEKFYAVKVGHQPGIYTSWNDCKTNVDGYKNPVFRKFESIEEAQTFMTSKFTKKEVSPNKGTNHSTKKHVNTEKYLSQYKNLIESKEYLNDIPYTIEKWSQFNNELFIFTDGSYKNNGQEMNSGFAVYLGKECINVKELYTNKTNNQCELAAVDVAFKIILKYYKKVIQYRKPINIVSDSEYTIKACSEWIKKWKENDWKTSNGGDVKNRELIESIDNSMNKIRILNGQLSTENQIQVKFVHIKSHQEASKQGTYQYFIWEGNLIADALAQNSL